MAATAIVMNVYYTGLGIARSLGEHGVPVIGLTSHRGVYGNFTRYARVRSCPDSRSQPEALLEYFLKLRRELSEPPVVFPTRDDDLVFLDRFREDLAPRFRLVLPERDVLNACLNKWETYVRAREAGVPAPRSWLIEELKDLHAVLSGISYPCVLKPLAAHHWRQGRNWDKVGGRKAICISSRQELLAEYALVAQADHRALVQEMVPGGDDCLWVAACYLDKDSQWVAGFNAQKLVQSPPGFGTGCIVQAAERPELFDRTVRLLQQMRFTGIAEVEYKWDIRMSEYQLIEINPRPWDQHRLGKTCGIDLIYLAYCDQAGWPRPELKRKVSSRKWIAEDSFFMAALRFLWRRDPAFWSLLRLARGKRVYAIWSARDPLPLIGYSIRRFGPGLVATAVRFFWSAGKARVSQTSSGRGKEDLVYEEHIEKRQKVG
jgi:D-aspartate ligase